jgi:hypothetical protein
MESMMLEHSQEPKLDFAWESQDVKSPKKLQISLFLMITSTLYLEPLNGEEIFLITSESLSNSNSLLTLFAL